MVKAEVIFARQQVAHQGRGLVVAAENSEDIDALEQHILDLR